MRIFMLRRGPRSTRLTSPRVSERNPGLGTSYHGGVATVIMKATSV
jgi:hypothetical protein